MDWTISIKNMHIILRLLSQLEYLINTQMQKSNLDWTRKNLSKLFHFQWTYQLIKMRLLFSRRNPCLIPRVQIILHLRLRGMVSRVGPWGGSRRCVVSRRISHHTWPAGGHNQPLFQPILSAFVVIVLRIFKLFKLFFFFLLFFTFLITDETHGIGCGGYQAYLDDNIPAWLGGLGYQYKITGMCYMPLITKKNNLYTIFLYYVAIVHLKMICMKESYTHICITKRNQEHLPHFVYKVFQYHQVLTMFVRLTNTQTITDSQQK